MARFRPMQLRGPTLKGWTHLRTSEEKGEVVVDESEGEGEGSSQRSGRKESGRWKFEGEW